MRVVVVVVIIITIIIIIIIIITVVVVNVVVVVVVDVVKTLFFVKTYLCKNKICNIFYLSPLFVCFRLKNISSPVLKCDNYLNGVCMGDTLLSLPVDTFVLFD